MVNATRDQGEPAAERVLTTLLVSSDPEVLETMRRALSSPSITYVGEAWPGIDAARRAAATQPDVVVLHVEDPLVPALRTVQAIAEACPAGIAVISSLTDIETVRRVEPREVFCTHGPAEFADHLRDLGFNAYPLQPAAQRRLF